MLSKKRSFEYLILSKILWESLWHARVDKYYFLCPTFFNKQSWQRSFQWTSMSSPTTMSAPLTISWLANIRNKHCNANLTIRVKLMLGITTWLKTTTLSFDSLKLLNNLIYIFVHFMFEAMFQHQFKFFMTLKIMPCFKSLFFLAPGSSFTLVVTKYILKAGCWN